MMAMRWIHANGSREDVRELRDILSADMQVKIAAGAEMVDNTWSVTIPESAWNAAPVEIGHYFYSPGTEWGGPVTLVTHSTGDKTVTLQGPTWRGLLFRKLIYPAAGEDYYEITDADANAALATLIGSRFGSLMAVSAAVSGVEVSGRWRYATLAEAIDGMFRAYNLRLAIAYDDANGRVVLSAAGVSSLADMEVSQDYGVDFTSSIGNTTPANHAVVIWSGEDASGVTHVYWTEDGYTTTQPAGWTEAENREVRVDCQSTEAQEILKAGIDALQAAAATQAVSIDQLRLDVSAELGDHLAIRDRVTGLTAEAVITNKILTIQGGQTTIQMDVDTVTEEA